jgi:DNA-binding transcriptional LysR family regulator
MFARAAIYFDEVAKLRSIKRASERLHIAPSAIDRQILQLEGQLGTRLFDRSPQGLRLTGAGEVLVDAVRRWRREYSRVEAQIDALKGMRRGEISIALVEGATQFLARNLRQFQVRYPAIGYKLQVAGSQAVVDAVLRGDCDVGLTFNPPESHGLRVERTLIYRLGAVMRPDHPMAAGADVSLLACADHALIVPDESISLRDVIDRAWAGAVGGPHRFAIVASSVTAIKTLALEGMGIGLLTSMDAFAEIDRGDLVFRPLAEEKVPLSVLSLVSGSGRPLSVSASLLLQHLGGAMMSEPAVSI